MTSVLARCALPLALVAVSVLAPAAVAQVPSAPAELTPHERVFRILEGGFSQEAALNSTLAELARQMAQVPRIAALESAHPGTIVALQEAARPVIVASGDRISAKYRPRMIAVLRDELTAAEATEIADFYASPLGLRIIAVNAANTQSGNIVRSAIAQRPVTTAEVQADIDSTGNATFASLSEAEQAQVIREVLAHPALAKLTPLLPKIAAVRAEMEREPLTAEEQEALDAALQSVVAPLLR